MRPSRAAERRLEEFARSLTGLEQDGVIVESATAVFEDRPDVGDYIIRIRLNLLDGDPDRPTWPVDALHTFDRTIRERSYGLEFDEFVYIDFREAGAHDDGPEAADRP